MQKQAIEYMRYYEQVMRAMTSQGLLLGSYDASGKANLMTIGWGAIGSIWGVPVWMVLVRPSRYTYRCIEHSACFSVNVPAPDMHDAVAVCGSRSGRDVVKFADAGLTEVRGEAVLAPTVEQCPIVYECQVVHHNDILPDKLADEILSGAYMDGDYHRVYFGKILAARAAVDATKLLE